MLQDLRFSIRSLLHAPGFAAAAILTLGFGIGASTMAYGIVDGLLLRPLPFGDRSDRLVTIHSTHPTQTSLDQIDDAGVSYADAIDFRESGRAFDAIELVGTRSVSLSSDNESERVSAASVTTGFFRMLGVVPALGRDFEAADGAIAGFEHVAIISDGLWRRLYNGRSDIIGQNLLLNGRSLTVAGVMPPSFDFPEGQQVWLPLRQAPGLGRDRREALMAIGLRREDVTLEQARDDLNAVAAALAKQFPDTNRDWSAYVAPMRDYLVSAATRRSVTAMFVAVALVLLVGCANIAGLLVARGLGRDRELTVRAALGASRDELVRLLLAEAALVSAVGGLAGLLIAAWGLKWLLSSMPEPPPLWAMPAIDARALLFAIFASAASAIAAGLLPALRLSRVRPSGSLLTGTRQAGATVEQRRLQSLLVAAQVAASLVLIVGAVLLSKSVLHLQRASVGFDPAPLASLRFYIAGDQYDDPAVRAQTIQRIAERLASLPGAVAAAVTGSIPADDGGAVVNVVPPGVSPEAGFGATIVPVSPEFWPALGIRLSAGRAFTPTEAVDPAAGAVVVSGRLAARLWGDDDAVGRVIRLIEPGGPAEYRVVGVAPDLVYEEIGEETDQSRMVIYVPHARRPYRTLAAIIRTQGDPASVLQPARAAVRGIDPAFAAFDTMTMVNRRVATQWSERFMGRTFTALAAMGLLLACLGAYGLTAYAATRRAREIGVRLAIGATRGDILRLLLSRGARLAVAGALAGLPLAALAARAMSGMLYQMSPWDPAIWVSLPLLMVIAVLIASFVPAHRASGADPSHALRAE